MSFAPASQEVEPAAPAVVEYVPPVDTTPPVLTLKGDGQLAVTPAGVMIMIDTVAMHGRWEHAGATAHDVEDGDLTDQVSAFGLAAVSTAAATPGEAPYIITYR